MNKARAEMKKIQPLTDEQRKAANPLVSAWVQANAGTGKTKLLVGRLLQILFRTDLRPNQTILCLTYTKAGAGEMHNRITKALKEWSLANDNDLSLLLSDIIPNQIITPEHLARARSIFYKYIDNPDMLKVKTIHSFCEEILHRFPTEAGLSPSWSVITDTAKDSFQQEVFNRMLVSSSLDSETRAVLERVLLEYGETNFKELQKNILDFSSLFAEIEDADNYRKYFIETIEKKLGIPSVPPKECDEVSLGAALAYCPTLKQTQAVEKFALVGKKFLNHETDFEEYKKVCLTAQLTIRSGNNGLTRFPELLDELERVRNVALYAVKKNILQQTLDFFDLTRAFADEYANLKKQHNALDFNDMVLYTNKLFSCPQTMGWILSQLDTSISHILLDEAQDTGVQQWNLLNKLTNDFFTDGDTSEFPRTMLVVGDTKQAIYGFQNANPRAFANSRAVFEARLRNSAREYAGETNLTTSFRSAEPILQAVDCFFNDEYIRTRFGFINNDHKCCDVTKKGLMEIYALETKKETDENTDMTHSRYTKHICDKIKELIDSGKYEPSKIMVLVRNRFPYGAEIARKLRKRNIELAGTDKIILPEFPVIVDLLHLVRFCLDITNDYSLACVLKSPIFRLTDMEVYKICKKRNDESDRLKASGNSSKSLRLFDFVRDEYPKIYERLQAYKSKMESSGPYAFFSYVLDNDETREKMVAALGPQILEPLREFMTLCLAYERTQPGTLKHFLKWFVTGGSSVKRDLSSSDVTGVRILTIHGSKGLEAPVVFLVDTMRDQTKKKTPPIKIPDEKLKYPVWLCLPSKKIYSCISEVTEIVKQFQAQDQEENFRLLYVAMTRAQERLYIYGCAAAQPKEDDLGPEWHTMLWDVLGKKQEPFIEVTDEKIRISNE